MKKPQSLRKGDKVAIVSLSSGMLGGGFCSHNIETGVKRLRAFGLEPVFMPNALKGIDFLKEHPEARASDLKAAFADDSIKGIICAIGGDDTYRLLPYLMEDEEFTALVRKNPKLFTGFSDTTINHLMFYKLGMTAFYGPNFICDLGEIANEMLPYTKRAFEGYFAGQEMKNIAASDLWYEERKDFSRVAMGTDRVAHREERGYEILQGEGKFRGRLLGGCLESFYEFDAVNGILVGKPQDEQYYEEYKEIYAEVIENKALPILYNINFGHAMPRCALPYGAEVEVDMEGKQIVLLESAFV